MASKGIRSPVDFKVLDDQNFYLYKPFHYALLTKRISEAKEFLKPNYHDLRDQEKYRKLTNVFFDEDLARYLRANLMLKFKPENATTVYFINLDIAKKFTALIKLHLGSIQDPFLLLPSS